MLCSVYCCTVAMFEGEAPAERFQARRAATCGLQCAPRPGKEMMKVSVFHENKLCETSKIL